MCKNALIINTNRVNGYNKFLARSWLIKELDLDVVTEKISLTHKNKIEEARTNM
jgi:hypothetical protein